MGRVKNPIAKTYLLFYNVALTLGWIYVGYLAIKKWNEPAKIWTQTEVPLKIIQTAAIMEIVHAILGLTSTNVLTVGFQVGTRLLTVWGSVNLSPPAQISTGLTLLLTCWTITEICRYTYYALHLVGLANIIVWYRYSLFIILYPIGATGEVWACLDGLDYIKNHNLWSISLPNSWNATFNYHVVLFSIAMLSITTLFPFLYLHMFSQRRKVLGKDTRPSKSSGD